MDDDIQMIMESNNTALYRQQRLQYSFIANDYRNQYGSLEHSFLNDDDENQVNSYRVTYRMGKDAFENLVNELSIHEEFNFAAPNAIPVYIQVSTALFRLANCHVGYRQAYMLLGASYDGKNFTIHKPSPEEFGAMFRDCKNDYSVKLTAVCDSDLRFTYITVGDSSTDGKRKIKDSDKLESGKIQKKKLQLPPSVSTNKPRINGDDAKKLNDYFVAVIDPHSGDETLDCTRQEYELNMEEQRVLHCFKKKAGTFNILDFCLNGTLDNLLDRMDDIKAKLGDNDDERQDIRLLRYILSDYHANCSKPSYNVIPRNVLLLLNISFQSSSILVPQQNCYLLFGKKMIGWCEKGSPSNKQLMLCLSVSQRKLLDGIGLYYTFMVL
ncbi:hypothetical protein INT47_001325 [Mucor saturninus]|uniref:Uncharacterized protein n=1 Tax=Mucor saturninus TaxID=64648 RepID=A0A8H7UXC3_9FUNG|nr:hypothetical protein INT47_001325 [Mucor saturninus]